MKAKSIATIYAILAAALYAINVPVSKKILNYVEPTMMASFLYLGAGLGLLIYGLFQTRISKGERKERLTKKELPYTVAMVVLDIAAPILLMLGITMTNSANVSLLNNFEIVATSIIALVIFKEIISKRLWFAIVLVTVASIVLNFEGVDSITFNKGSLFVLGAAKTSAYYAIAPFLGVAFSMLLLNERSGIQFYLALLIMIFSTYLMIKDTMEVKETE